MFDSVLVIDDDQIFCETAKTYLAQLEVARVLVAHDGSEALPILQNGSNQVDLVILDLTMPDVDGIQVLGELQKLSFSGSIAIVTGETSVIRTMAAELGKQYGLNIIDVVSKPLHKTDMDRWFAGQEG